MAIQFSPAHVTSCARHARRGGDRVELRRRDPAGHSNSLPGGDDSLPGCARPASAGGARARRHPADAPRPLPARRGGARAAATRLASLPPRTNNASRYSRSPSAKPGRSTSSAGRAVCRAPSAATINTDYGAATPARPNVPTPPHSRCCGSTSTMTRTSSERAAARSSGRASPTHLAEQRRPMRPRSRMWWRWRWRRRSMRRRRRARGRRSGRRRARAAGARRRRRTRSTAAASVPSTAQQDEPRERRVAELAARRQLGGGEGGEVVRRRGLQAVVLRLQRLHDRPAPASRRVRRGPRPARAVGTCARRRGSRESSATGIGEHDADQRHARHVVALGDHLRADQDVEARRRANRRASVCWLPLRRVVSRSMRATRAPGKALRAAAPRAARCRRPTRSAPPRRTRCRPAAAEWCSRSSGSAAARQRR